MFLKIPLKVKKMVLPMVTKIPLAKTIATRSIPTCKPCTGTTSIDRINLYSSSVVSLQCTRVHMWTRKVLNPSTYWQIVQNVLDLK